MENNQKLVTKKSSLTTLKEDVIVSSEYSKNDEKVAHTPGLFRKLSLATLKKKKSLSSLGKTPTESSANNLNTSKNTREDLIPGWNSRTCLDMEILDEELYIPNQAHTPSQPLFPTFNFPMASNFPLDSLIVSQQQKSSSSYAINVFYSDLSYLLGCSNGNNNFSSANWREKKFAPEFTSISTSISTSNQRRSILIDEREMTFNRTSVW
ncbi:9482_t:CDS:2 [Ambispora gerdemannii]|uniref:9482_t:CDS:1 n=1 Tax=Ambispora gerdemannii TaxID=144530 RepID=A0A9N8W9E7_9GLOM|nr:9482_t:CDS:2 [Ambispora gerdemannii]